MSHCSFSEDLDFLRNYFQPVVLSDASGNSKLVICPELQSRVMTSTCGGMDGMSQGFINHRQISSGQGNCLNNHAGGEDRFWLGPEGGQYSLFLHKGDPIDEKYALTPSFLDSEPFDLVNSGNGSAWFRKSVSLTNYYGSRFQLTAERQVRILTLNETENILRINAGDIEGVFFESSNRMTNTGINHWCKEGGLVSVNIAGMFPPAESVIVFFPFIPGANIQLGPVINEPSGHIPEESVKIFRNNIFLKGDGRYRFRTGLSPLRALPLIGSFNAETRILTVINFVMPGRRPADYVNSAWEFQEEPYWGDVTSFTSDHLVGKGIDSDFPFYELRSSSPAVPLKPGDSVAHTHRTFHFTGSDGKLDNITVPLFGCTIKEIKNVFG
jgi:hypothetical protein